jgi:hypothetical protein
MGTYLPTANTPGRIAAEFSWDPEYPKERMRNNCLSYGGLNEDSIIREDIPSWAGLSIWRYSCNGKLAPSAIKTQPQSANSVNQNGGLDSAKQRCAELGFKSGTEGFGKCVLQLSK